MSFNKDNKFESYFAMNNSKETNRLKSLKIYINNTYIKEGIFLI